MRAYEGSGDITRIVGSACVPTFALDYLYKYTNNLTFPDNYLLLFEMERLPFLRFDFPGFSFPISLTGRLRT